MRLRKHESRPRPPFFRPSRHRGNRQTRPRSRQQCAGLRRGRKLHRPRIQGNGQAVGGRSARFGRGIGPKPKRFVIAIAQNRSGVVAALRAAAQSVQHGESAQGVAQNDFIEAIGCEIPSEGFGRKWQRQASGFRSSNGRPSARRRRRRAQFAFGKKRPLFAQGTESVGPQRQRRDSRAQAALRLRRVAAGFDRQRRKRVHGIQAAAHRFGPDAPGRRPGDAASRFSPGVWTRVSGFEGQSPRREKQGRRRIEMPRLQQDRRLGAWRENIRRILPQLRIDRLGGARQQFAINEPLAWRWIHRFAVVEPIGQPGAQSAWRRRGQWVERIGRIHPRLQTVRGSSRLARIRAA
ncbi:MAG: hypothetical protein BWZ10_03188 [candidate division BRC1 bacterium ADurb.BinA364]|nr:MAG: hypothetical protein BWZ10_03188 [candidate division BRC1 bacterium ADurb.BinA364]